MWTQSTQRNGLGEPAADPLGLSRRRLAAVGSGQRGSALLMALMGVLVIAGLSVASVSFHVQTSRSRAATRQGAGLQQVAMAGMTESLLELRNGGDGAVGTPGSPSTFSATSYYVEVFDLNSTTKRLLATAEDGSSVLSVEAVARVAEPVAGGLFSRAIAAKDDVSIASNTLVDSFDPTVGSYASQLGRSGFVGGNAGLRTNGSVCVASNTEFYGDVMWGPESDDFALISGNANISGMQSPASEDMDFPEIEVPEIQGGGSYSIGRRKVTVLGPGDVAVDSIKVSNGGLFKVVGPARLLVGDITVGAGGAFELDATLGEIEMYVEGDFELKSNSSCQTSAGDASQVSLYLLGEHSSPYDSSPSVQFNSNANFVGGLYAPDLQVSISSNFEVFGAIAAKFVELRSNTKLHYDESMAAGDDSDGKFASCELLSWRRVTPSQVDLIRSTGGALGGGEDSSSTTEDGANSPQQ